MHHTRGWFWGGLGLLLTVSVWADPVRLDPGVELQRQQQEQRLQQQLSRPVPALVPDSKTPSAVATATGACAAVQHIEVGGVTRLSAERLAALAAAYENRCLTTADIGQLLQAVNAAYVGEGYVTSRAYLPEQRIADGTLRLLVIEGRIESLTLNDNHRTADRRRAALAFPARAGDVLRLQDIEQGVDQLNRAPSAQAAVALEPGSATGTSRVVVETVDERSWRAGLQADNSGEAATGRIKTTATLDKDNLFEANDVWQMAFSRSTRSRAFSLSPLLPLGNWTVNGSYSRSDYSNPLGNGYNLNGSSHSTLLNLERLLLRNQTDQWSVIAGVNNREGERDVAGVTLLPDTTTTARLGLRWLHRDAQVATWYGQISVVRGIDAWQATPDPAGLPDAYPHHQFSKLDMQAQYTRTLALGWTYSSQLQAQYSAVGLVGGEQLILGGNDALRGFATSSAYGDTGLGWRNQIGSACLPAQMPRLQCFAFADAGLVRAHVSPPMQRLAGAGGGARMDYPNFFAEASTALPLYASDAVRTEGLQFYLQVGLHY